MTDVRAGHLVALAGTTTTPHAAKLVVTPVDSPATGPIGQQTISPSDGTTTIPSSPANVSVPSPIDPSVELLGVTGPTFSAGAVDGAAGVVTSANLKALGQLALLTVPLRLDAVTLTDVAQVDSDGATAKKTLTLGALALPSLQDLLAALGVDLDALVQQLTQGKLDALAGLVGGVAPGLDAAVDSAQATVGGGAADTLSAATSAATTASDDLDQADQAFADGITAVLTAAGPLATLLTGAGIDASTTAADYLAAVAGNAALSDATLVALADAAVAAQTVLDAANALVDALQALVDGVVAAVTTSDDPLADLGDVTVTTTAVASKSSKADADVKVGSVHVLGLTNAIPVDDLAGELGAVTGTLDDVLESVAGVSFTAPAIAVGTPKHSTSRQGRTRSASASITGLTLTLPSITFTGAPASAIALAGAPTGVSGSVTLGQLGETAQWTPGSTSTSPGSPTAGDPSSSGGNLPDTGGRVLLPVIGLIVIGVALALHRRSNRSA